MSDGRSLATYSSCFQLKCSLLNGNVIPPGSPLGRTGFAVLSEVCLPTALSRCLWKNRSTGSTTLRKLLLQDVFSGCSLTVSD